MKMKKKKKGTPVDQAIGSMISDHEKSEYEKVKKKPAMMISIMMGKDKKKC